MTEQRKTKVLTTRIEGNLANDILRYCERIGKTPSEVIREVLKRHMVEVDKATSENWEKIEGAKKRSECLYFIEGRCDKHTYEKGQFPEALRKKANEMGLKIKEWTREWTEGLFPFLVTRKVDYECLVPTELFCRDCRLWRPKEGS